VQLWGARLNKQASRQAVGVRARGGARRRPRRAAQEFLVIHLLPAVALVALGAAAHAADAQVPMKAAPAAAPAAFGWTGCYVGGHLGGGFGRKTDLNPTGLQLSNGVPLLANPTGSLIAPVSGFAGGAQAGCRYEFAPRWVVGVGGDFSATHLVSERSLFLSPFNPSVIQIPTTFRAQTDWLASATADLGYVIGGVLVYAKGGAAWTRDKYGIVAAPDPFTGLQPLAFTANETRTGWTVGAGLEYPFWRNLSARLEYDYYDFGTTRVHFTDSLSPTTGDIDVKQHIHAVKLGLNYAFWTGPAPAPAPAAPLITKAPASAPVLPIGWTQTFSSEVRYFSWQSNRGVPNNAVGLSNVAFPLAAPGHGTELYIPYATQLVGTADAYKIELLVRGGWVSARQSTAGLTGAVATATDTVASGTFTYLGFNGVQPFVAIQTNLPTGLAALGPNQVRARMDPDLVDIATFGEGLNIGPTLGFNLPISSKLLLTLSAAYTHRGDFEREGPLTPAAPNTTPAPTMIDPGDVTTLTGTFAYQLGQLTGNVTGTVAQEGATRQDGTPFVRPGRRYVLAGTWAYAWPGEHAGRTTVTASASHSDRNDVLFQCLAGCPTALTLEPFNTNSNLYRAGIEHLFLAGQAAFGPTATFLFRDQNAYVPTTLQFVPAKTRWAAGALARYVANDHLLLNARIEHVWTHEDPHPALPGDQQFSVLAGSTVTAFSVPVVSSTGWQVAIGATAQF